MGRFSLGEGTDQELKRRRRSSADFRRFSLQTTSFNNSSPFSLPSLSLHPSLTMFIQTVAAVAVVGYTLVSGAALFPRVRYTTTDIAARGASHLSFNLPSSVSPLPHSHPFPSRLTLLTWSPSRTLVAAGWSYPVHPLRSSLSSSVDHPLTRSVGFRFSPSLFLPGPPRARGYHSRSSRYRYADWTLWRGIRLEPNQLPSL